MEHSALLSLQYVCAHTRVYVNTMSSPRSCNSKRCCVSWRRDKQRVVPGKMVASGTGSQLAELKQGQGRESPEVCMCACERVCV